MQVSVYLSLVYCGFIVVLHVVLLQAIAYHVAMSSQPFQHPSYSGQARASQELFEAFSYQPLGVSLA